MNQSCTVIWNGAQSYSFKVSNGVRQGAVTSPILFSVYINGLFRKLRSSGLGCHLFGQFCGCFGYADDILLLSGSRSGLQSLVSLCSQFMEKKCLKFSTSPDPWKSKTKCIIFSQKTVNTSTVRSIELDGKSLPWVSQIKHLGNILD